MEKLEQLIPLEVAAEHYAAAMTRGESAGQQSEYIRIVDVLKKHGHYDAVLTLKRHERKASLWSSQKVI
jgi:hypothetical protein